MTASEIITYMESIQDEKQRKNLMRFFKTGRGEYGEGDRFLGLKVPQTRKVVRHCTDLPFEEIPQLLQSQWHEVRLCGFLLLVKHFEDASKPRFRNIPEAILRRDKVVEIYLQFGTYANNWDLVDLSAPKILGHWLLLPTYLGSSPGEEAKMHEGYKLDVLDRLASSPCLWLQRMSMVCTWKTSQMGDPSFCLRYAEIHLRHPHDLMHKAVGWMLREMGKRISMDLLRDFLQLHAHEMPRTTLRYAIEKMDAHERTYWMSQH